ncbi:cupredoxin domain-containing protein [Candidatus Saganbacteria bacterium]|nr:cupredoxin domain-containing protein [Candidatus Saganbacteria bacterium]
MKKAVLVLLAALFWFNSAWAMGSAPKKENYKVEILKMEVVPAPSTAGLQVIKVIAKRYEFIPNAIEVKAGRPVRLILTSEDVTHGFALKEFGIDKQIETGKETIVEFTPDKTGAFDFRCSVFCGLGHMGMKGKLIVK